MTVSSTSSRVVYAGDGTTTAFPFAFKVLQAADLVVVYTDATGTDFTLSPSQYGVSGFGLDAGGTVTYPPAGSPPGSPIAPATTLTIYRSAAAVQPASFSNQGAMWPQVIETALDRIVMLCQGVIDTAARALVVSPTDGGALAPLPGRTTRANSVLAFDPQGQPYAATLGTTLTGSLVAASTWLIANFLPMTSAAAARGAIGAAGLVDNNAFSGTNTFPTQAAADSSTKAATTAQVQAAIDARAYALRVAVAPAVNFNAANSDTAIAIALPAGFTRYRIERVTIGGASQSLTTATCGLFTAAAGSGVAVVAGATAITVSATADATANNLQSLTPASSTTSFTAPTLYFRVQTAQGAAATGDVAIFYQPLK